MNEDFAPRFALLFADLAVKSLLVLGVAWIASALLRRGPASTRHLVWLIGFSMLVLLPILMAVVPSHSLGIFHQSMKSAPNISQVNQPISKADLSSIESQLSEISGTSGFEPVRSDPLPARWNWHQVIPMMGVLWLVGWMWIVLQSVWGFLAIYRMRKGSIPAQANISDRVDSHHLSQKMGINRSWELRLSAGSKPPTAMTWGFMKPIVLLPQESSSWSTERLEAVLLHELAHVRRFDSVTQFISVVTCAFYWFNPVVWLCARAMRAEAETAADDTVLRHGVKPSVYAGELIRIAAELGHRRQPFSPIGVPVMKQSKIESRVKAILDPSPRHRRGVTALEVLAAAGVATAILLPFSSVRAGIAPLPKPDLSAIQSFVATSTVAVPMPPSGAVSDDTKESSGTSKSQSVHANSSSISKSLSACTTAPLTTSKQSESAEKQKAKIDKERAELKAHQQFLEKVQRELESVQRKANFTQELAEVAKRDAEVSEIKAKYLQRRVSQSPYADIKSAAAIARIRAEAEDRHRSGTDLQKALGELQADHAKLLAEKMELVQRASADKQNRDQEIQNLYTKSLDERLTQDQLAKKQKAEADDKKYQATIDRLLVSQYKLKYSDLKKQKLAEENMQRAFNSMLAERYRASSSSIDRKKALNKMMVDRELDRARSLLDQAFKSREQAQTLYGRHSLSGTDFAKAKEALRQAKIQVEIAMKLLESQRSKHP